MIGRLLTIVLLLFPLSEVALAIVKRSRRREAKSQDRGSMAILWMVIMLGIFLAYVAQFVRPARIPAPRSAIEAVALALMVGGLALRWVAILTLGKLFTVDVAIHADHSVVDTGLYRHMRHPSYTGLMTAFLGFGVYFGNWVSIIAMLLPITLGLLNRVAMEEKTLRTSLGPAYETYCARTKRFLPGIF
jgi:protein-S-isoprenylcysteine O-methyltransferase Ste14